MEELFKWIGSASGLLSGLFLLYDRYAKGRPIASFTVTEERTSKQARIRVTNVSEYDIAIIDATVKPQVYGLTDTMGTRDLIEAAAGKRPSAILKPRENKELIIVPLFTDGVAREVIAQNVTFCLSWRRCNATWLPQIPVYVRTSTTTIRKYALHDGW